MGRGAKKMLRPAFCPRIALLLGRVSSSQGSGLARSFGCFGFESRDGPLRLSSKQSLKCAQRPAFSDGSTELRQFFRKAFKALSNRLEGWRRRIQQEPRQKTTQSGWDRLGPASFFGKSLIGTSLPNGFDASMQAEDFIPYASGFRSSLVLAGIKGGLREICVCVQSHGPARKDKKKRRGTTGQRTFLCSPFHCRPHRSRTTNHSLTRSARLRPEGPPPPPTLHSGVLAPASPSPRAPKKATFPHLFLKGPQVGSTKP